MDQLTTRALSTAAALLDAAAKGDRWAMRHILRPLHEVGTDGEIGSITRAVAHAHHVEVGAILNDDRRRHIVNARQTACYIAVELFNHAYAETGRALDLDHTTVINAVRRVSADPLRRKGAEEIAERLGWVGKAAS